MNSRPSTGAHVSSSGLALTSLALAMLLASLGTSVANVALPTLARAFDVPFQAAQWVVLAYLLATTSLIVGVGRIGDLVGRRSFLLAGLALFTVASMLCGLAPNLPVLIAARAMQGLGAAIMMALAMALIRETVPQERTGSAMGLLGTMSAIGTALGPTLGGTLIAAFGWRAIFLVSVPLSATTFVLAWRSLPADRPVQSAHRSGFDLAGSMLLALTLAAYALAMTVGHGNVGLLNGALMVFAVTGLVLFIVTESRVASPLVQLELLREPALRAGLTMSALVSTVMMATLVVGPFYLARTLGLGAAQVGMVMSVGPGVVALTGVPAGRLIDRTGTHRMTTAGLIAMGAGALALAGRASSAGVVGYLAPIGVLTLGYALFQTANNTAIMRNIEPSQRGVVSGLANLSRNLGLITGASALGAVFAFASGTSDFATAPPNQVADGMRATFAVATILIAASLVVARSGRPVPLPTPTSLDALKQSHTV